jgi:hypothetical protein
MRVRLDRRTSHLEPLRQRRRGHGALLDDFDHQALEHGQQDGVGFVMPVVPRFKHGAKDVA